MSAWTYSIIIIFSYVDVKEASYERFYQLECERNARMHKGDPGFVTAHETSILFLL